ncbi:D-3-phosphoglycerate dehydrogenase [Aspergillus heterothallicus]
MDITKASKPTVFVLDEIHPKALEYGREIFNIIALGEPGHEKWREAEYLMIRTSHLTAADIASCPNLKAIGKQGVGIEKIDTKACDERGIKIFNTPGANSRAVAELVAALALSLARQIPRIYAQELGGARVAKEKCSGLLLTRRTVGILGMGNIGLEVARIFSRGFDAEIVAYDPFLPSEAWADVPHKRASSIEDVLRVSDLVTPHMPLLPETRGLISYPQFQIMKRNAILVNAARGGIVSETDLERALREGLIWGASLDCHEEEPPSADRYGELWKQNVVSTPHIGAVTEETLIGTATVALQRLHEFAVADR